MQNSPREWLIVLILFLPVMSLPQRGAKWGVGFVIHGGGAWRNITGQGRVELQLNNIQMKTHQNATTNLPFFLSPKTLHCLELVEEDVLCCSAKVCKLAEIQGGDCGDDRKSHCSRVCVKNICAIKLGAAICITHWATLWYHICTLRYCAMYVTVLSAIFVGRY